MSNERSPHAAALVLDLDDTLFPERAFAASGFSAVAKAFSHLFGDSARAANDMVRLFHSGHRGRVFDQLLTERGRPAEPVMIRRMVETYRTHRPSLTLFPDADAALSRLRATHRLGLITDGPVTMQRSKVEALGLRQRIEAIILTDELGPDFGKPDPRSFELMARRLGAQHQQCVYVADNPAKDFVAPNALGWTTIRIVRPDGIYRDAPEAPGGRPHHVIHTLDGLDALIA